MHYTTWPTPLLYAHRGASRELPENTLPSFERALSLGVTALELDVHRTLDGELMVSHDHSGERMAGVPRPIAGCTFAHVRQWNMGARFEPPAGSPPLTGTFTMPTLDEVLESFPDAWLNIDAKPADEFLLTRLVHTVHRHNAARRVRVASFHTRNLIRARMMGYQGETGMTGPEVAALLAAPWLGRVFPRMFGRAAQIPTKAGGLTLGSSSMINTLHRAGVRVDFWTINDPLEARALLDMGADGIMTDDPRRMLQVFNIGQ